jgi:hypothetical protein
MQCQIFQPLIRRKNQVDSDLKQQDSVDALAEFNKNFGEGCKALVENEQTLKSGVGLDGKPIKARLWASGWPVMKSIIEVCKKPSQESAEELVQLIKQRDQRTCEVRTDRSQVEFTLDPQTQSWISQEGPIGPCAAFILSTLTQEVGTPRLVELRGEKTLDESERFASHWAVLRAVSRIHP